MIWQDLVIMVANVVFSISLFPQILEGFKNKKGVIKLITSGPTTIGLFAISYALFSLDLFLSAAVSFISAIMWATLFFQKITYN